MFEVCFIKPECLKTVLCHICDLFICNKGKKLRELKCDYKFLPGAVIIFKHGPTHSFLPTQCFLFLYYNVTYICIVFSGESTSLLGITAH